MQRATLGKSGSEAALQLQGRITRAFSSMNTMDMTAAIQYISTEALPLGSQVYYKKSRMAILGLAGVLLCENGEAYTKWIIICSEKNTYTYLQNKRMRRCGVAPPPPIIFERLKLSQQIIYRRKENLSDSPNHQKYWENILVWRFYEQFSRNRRILSHFRNFEKISNS